MQSQGAVAYDRSVSRPASEGQASSGRLRTVVRTPLPWLVVVASLGAVARWPSIAGESLWFDEWVTQQLVRDSATELLPDVKGSESTPPLYYVLAWGWAHIFGSEAFALRSLSWLFGVATIPIAYFAAATLATRRVGVIAAAFVAVNPLLVWYSTEARAYSLLVLLSTLSLLTFARFLASPRLRELAFWSLTACLILTTHYFGAFLIAAEALFLIARAPCARRTVLLGLLPVGVTALLLLPLAYLQRGHTDWVASLPLDARVEELGRNFLGGVSTPGLWLELVVAGLAVIAAAFLVRADRRERHAAALWLAVGAVAVAMPLIVAVVGPDYILTRNLIAACVPLLFVLAVACGARRAGWPGLAVACGLVAASLTAVVAVAVDERLQRVNWEQAADLLGSGERTRMVLAWGDYRLGPLINDFGPRRDFASGQSVRVREIDVLGFESPTGRISCWSGAACNMYDIELANPLALPGFRLAGRGRSGLFEVARYRARRPVPLRWKDIAAATAAYRRYGKPYVWVGEDP
jgi:mannosyltransferase